MDLDLAGIVGSITIGLLGIGAAALFPIWHRQRRTLDWSLVPQSAAPTAGHWVYVLRVKNTGDDAIVERDYARPITITAESGATIDAATAGNETDGLATVDPQVSGSTCTVRPLALNRGDSFDLTLTLTADSTLKVSASVVGQHRPLLNILAPRRGPLRADELVGPAALLSIAYGMLNLIVYEAGWAALIVGGSTFGLLLVGGSMINAAVKFGRLGKLLTREEVNLLPKPRRRFRR